MSSSSGSPSHAKLSAKLRVACARKISALWSSSLRLNLHPVPRAPRKSSLPGALSRPSHLDRSLAESLFLTEQKCMWCPSCSPSNGWESGRNYFSYFFFFMFSSQNGWGSPDPFLHFSMKSVFVCSRMLYLIFTSLVWSCQEKVRAAGDARNEGSTRQSSSQLVK